MFVEGSRRSFLLVFAILIACFAGPFDAGASAATLAVPSRLTLNVRETTGVARSGEVVRSGVPLARSLNVLGTSSLAIVDAAGTPVPAEFEVTARWNAGKSDATAPVQWLLVTFPATVGANQTAAYRLVTDGSATNPAPATQIHLTQSGNAVTVDTGAATFRLGADPGALFDEVALANGTRLITGSALSVQTGGSTYGHSTTRRVWVEHQGPLTAIVVVQGAYDTPAIGGGQVSTRRRYVFTAGSPTAIVRHVANWEGNLACNECVTTPAGTPNGVRIDKMRDDLTIQVGGTPTVTAVGNFSAPAVSRTAGADQSAWVRQQLRSDHTSPQSFDVNVAGATAAGVKADGGLLAASGPAGTVAIALNHMHRYEPQALRLLAGGHLAIDAVDDKTWLAHHQGLFATLAVTAAAGSPSRDDLNRTTWAPLNRPLHAWPEAEWLASSDAVDDFPVGQLPAALAGYDTAVANTLSRTVSKIDQLGINGMTTFGVYPRYWGKDGDDGEITCGADSDPTPNEHWDDVFWCGAWTDYHNTTSTAQIWAMRTGAVEWLDELGFPAALRTLHTQIMQCSPTERWFYCGQAPTGYGAYRTDFNSSHAYFENLMLYYWLTGDQTVLDIVQRGADSMRRYECPTRGPSPVLTPHGPDGPACAADYPVNTPDISLTGRVAQQWQNVFRFMGLASNDASFLEDYRLNFARAITQQYAALSRNGVTYGFWGGPDVTTPTSSGATFTTDSQWTIGMYDMHYLNRYQRDSGDAPLGIPAMRPSQVISSIAHTYKDIEPMVIGDGTVSGFWARLLQYNWTGSRMGGTLGTVVGADRELYNPEKTGAAEVLIRAGQQEGDAALIDYGRQLTVFMINAAIGERAPLGKLMGQDLTRLHPAVALLANGSGTPLPPPPPPPPGPTAPAAPGALTAQAASSSAIDLAWQDNSSDETSFRVEELVNGAYQEVQVLAAGTTRVQIGGLTAATSYSFRVRAANAAGSSAYSNTASATTQAAPPPPAATPAAPTSLTAQAASSTAINLAWQDNSTNEITFRVEQLVGAGYQEVQVLAAGTTRVQIIGLAPGTAYTFRVKAVNTAGASGYSNIASAITTAVAPPPSGTPGAPSSLSGWAAGPGEVVLNWIDNASNETAFRVERSINGAFQEVTAVGANITTARISGLPSGSGQLFRVRASNAAGTSAYSNTVTVTTPSPGPAAPGAPAGLAARALSSTAIQLTWSDGSTNETSFRIERQVGSSFQEILAVGANVTSAQIGGLSPATGYTFRVRAANSAGPSGYSNIASAFTAAGPTPPPALVAPQLTSASGLGGGVVRLNWLDRSTTETQFVVEKLVNGAYQAAVVVGANVITARVTGLRAGTSYTFRVKVVDARGQVAYSNAMNVTAR
jgi:chitodextrinase